MRAREFGVDNQNYNKFIEKYLQQYSSYEGSMDYAILIKGKWGSGKTFFIKQFMKKNKGIKFVYVSLFGLKRIDEVNEKIFEAFHPILSSKQMKFFSSVAQGAIKFGLKVDLENIILLDKVLNDELNKYIDLDIDKNKIFKNLFNHWFKKKNINDDNNKSNIVFIFDDLERCLIETKHLFSLINDFVEQKELKVILLANEDEINDENYSKFKEKVISKEFEINLNFEDAYFSFVGLLKNEEIKKVFKNNYLLIKDIFHKLEIYNLRILHQTFIEFELFVENINEKYFKNKEFIRSLLLHFFAFVMQYKKTNSIQEITRIETSFYKEGDDNKSIFQKKLGISLFGILIGLSFWKNFLTKGYLDSNAINNYIQNTVFFKEEIRPLWIKVWHYWELEEEEFDKLLLELKNKFFDCDEEFENFYILLHVIGIMIFFMEKGIIDVTKEQIEEQVEKYISKFKDSNFWKEKDFDIWDNPTGLGYLAEDNELFKKIKIHIDEVIKEIKKEQVQKNKDNDINNFIKELRESNKSNIYQILSSYEFIPFFDGFDKEKIDELINLPTKSLFIFNHIINNRYSDNYYLNNKKRYCSYVDEIDFLNKLKRLFDKKINKGKLKKLTKLAVTYLLNNIEDAISKLEKCKNESI